MTVHGSGRLADQLRTQVTDESVDIDVCCRDSVKAFRDAASTGFEIPSNVPVVYVTVDQGNVVLLKARVRECDPCPWCIRLYTTVTQERAVEQTQDEPRLLWAETDQDVLATIIAAVQSLAGSEHERLVTIFDPESQASVTSSVVHSHPDCSHTMERTDVSRDRLRSPRLDYEFYDSKFGIIRDIEWIDRSYDSPWAGESDVAVVVCWAVNPAFPRFPDAAPSFEVSSGTNRIRSEAHIRAIMEGIERFVAFAPAPTGWIAKEADVPTPTVTPEEFHTYPAERLARADFPFEAYAPSVEYNWVECTRLADDATVSIPSDFVYLTPRAAEVPYLLDNNTSGCGAHHSIEAATRNGVLELVERDAVMSHWYSQERKPHVDVESLPAWARYTLAPFRDSYEVHIVDITRYDGLPAVEACLVARDPETVPAFVIGAGCAPTRHAAIDSAITEVTGILHLATVGGVLDTGERLDRSAVQETADHLRYYSQHDRLEYLAAFREPSTTIPYDRIDPGCGESLSEIVRRLADHGVRLFRRELTPQALMRAYDVRVVRTLSPDLVPMHFGHQLERIDHPERGFDLEEIPAEPHPFA